MKESERREVNLENKNAEEKPANKYLAENLIPQSGLRQTPALRYATRGLQLLNVTYTHREFLSGP